MGAMGFALPAGIGVALASKKQVAVIAGDGGFQLNIQELQTVIRNKLPIKIIVINNQSHGMVRQFQETYFQGRLQSTVWGYSSPSFVDIAKAYGIRAWLVENEDQLESALEMFCEHPSEPCLLEVKVSINANAYPKMAFGKPISEMEPFSRPLAMEAT
jgi:acetolactate synthase-1/2/3 large subunit